MIGNRIWYRGDTGEETGIVVNEGEDDGRYYLVVRDDGTCRNVDDMSLIRCDDVTLEELLTHCDFGVRFIGEERSCYSK